MKLLKNNPKAEAILADAKTKLQQLLGVKVVLEIRPHLPLDNVPEEQWLEDVCAVLGVTPEQVRGKSRKRHIVQARHLAIYFLYKYSSRGYENVAAALGLTNHTSAIHAVATVQDLLHIGDPDMTEAHYLAYRQMRKYAVEVERY
jgi:chromosomal replication initiation ATPase DnaA